MSLSMLLNVFGGLLLVLLVLTLAAPAISARFRRIAEGFVSALIQVVATVSTIQKEIKQSAMYRPTFSPQPQRIVLCCLSIGLLLVLLSHYGGDPDAVLLWRIPVLYLPTWVLTNLGKTWGGRSRWRFLMGLWTVLWLLPLATLPLLLLDGSPALPSLLCYLCSAYLATTRIDGIGLLLLGLAYGALLLYLLPLWGIVLEILIVAFGIVILLCLTWAFLEWLALLHSAIQDWLSPDEPPGEQLEAYLQRTLFANSDPTHTDGNTERPSS